MKREKVKARQGWKEVAEALGFYFHTVDGKAYWAEGMEQPVCYSFTLRQIEEDLEDPTRALEEMCYTLVDRVCNSAESADLFRKLQIPEAYWAAIRASWNRGDKNLYGRFDFSYSGNGPAKMLEYNADTPTSLWESAYFQWLWLEEASKQGIIPEDIDQFNSIQEKLIDALGHIGVKGILHLAAAQGSAEDEGTVRYLQDCAMQAGLETKFIYVEDIGLDSVGNFVDMENEVITALFKLYPWESMMREEFGLAAAKTVEAGWCQFIEPIWKAILSNKGILPLLWEMFPDHPNLLPAYFDGTPEAEKLKATGEYARKPIFSREGANVTLVSRTGTVEVDGDYGEEGHVVQALAALPSFAGNHAVIGSWVVAGQPAGIGIREDNCAVTKDTSRYIPHYISR